MVPRGGYAPRGGMGAGVMVRGVPCEKLTDTCENITFPQLRWWAVKM